MRRKVSAILMGLAGWGLAGAISVSWYFSFPRYDYPMRGEDQLAVQEAFPGGSMRNKYEYWRCERRFYENGSENWFWVIYKSNHDKEVTTKGCW